MDGFLYRKAGGGRRPSAPEVHQALFAWFIDIRRSLWGRLPVAVFRAKCREIYAKWLEAQSEEVPQVSGLQCTWKWIRRWMQEYGASLHKPNKRFRISHEDKIKRIIEVVKHVWRARHFMLENFQKEPVIIIDDQMPLHRNESSCQ